MRELPSVFMQNTIEETITGPLWKVAWSNDTEYHLENCQWIALTLNLHVDIKYAITWKILAIVTTNNSSAVTFVSMIYMCLWYYLVLMLWNCTYYCYIIWLRESLCILFTFQTRSFIVINSLLNLWQYSRILFRNFGHSHLKPITHGSPSPTLQLFSFPGRPLMGDIEVLRSVQLKMNPTSRYLARCEMFSVDMSIFHP